MNELAKWAWVVLLGILFLGHWFFVIVAVEVVVLVLICWLKPEWLQRE